MKRNIALATVFLTATSSARADRLDDYVKGQMHAQQVPGLVVVVLKDSDIVAQRAYGLANIEFNVSMRVEDVFTIASVTKLFTAAAVVSTGRLQPKSP